MMKSESDNALTAHVPPYLRAYGSTYGSTSGRQQRYQSGSERAGWSHNETQKRDMERSWVSPRRWGSSLWRFGSVLVVLILLSIAVSSAHSRWTTGSWQAEPQQHMRSMKEGVNGMFIEVGRVHGSDSDGSRLSTVDSGGARCLYGRASRIVERLCCDCFDK